MEELLSAVREEQKPGSRVEFQSLFRAAPEKALDGLVHDYSSTAINGEEMRLRIRLACAALEDEAMAAIRLKVRAWYQSKRLTNDNSSLRKHWRVLDTLRDFAQQFGFGDFDEEQRQALH
jgi:hypothetical protein